MKANVLTIGDYVRYKSSKRIIQIENVWDDGVNYEFCQGGLDFIEEEEMIEPIPLTKEIMIKNDFNLNKEFQEWWKDGCPFNIMLGCDFDGECAWVRSELNQATPLLLIKHVHILQHALRLCGLNELAAKFKV